MVRSADVNIRAGFAATTTRRSVSDWLWRPWYAKLWWSAIPLWWTGMASSTQVASLERFYDGALAGFLNVLFFPLTALMVLGVGCVLNWREALFATQTASPADRSEIAEAEEEYLRAFEDLNATTDIHDPRSGTLYVGNAISQNNGGRISVF